MEPTPEQRAAFYALCNIINLGILAVIGWTMLCDWIECRYIDPWKEQIRREGNTR